MVQIRNYNEHEYNMSFTAQLVLKSGEVFNGEVPANQESFAFGEVVFNTGMVGYVESLTDPSYSGQILVFTYPLIGNYGVSDPSTWESEKIHVRGVVVSELSPFHSNHTAQQSLAEWLTRPKYSVYDWCRYACLDQMFANQRCCSWRNLPRE